MDADFNPETQYLAIKPEYSETPTEIAFRISAYGGVKIEEVRTFDPLTALPEEYETYFYRGFSHIFDIIDK